MFCTKCGAHIDDGANHCSNCGAPVEKVPGMSGPKGQVDVLRLSALGCLCVGALCMVIFCFRLVSSFGDMSYLFEMMDLGFVSPLVSLLLICVAAAAVFVPGCLVLMFAGKFLGNSTLSDQGERFLPISLLAQLVVESIAYGLLVLMLLIVMISDEGRAVLELMGITSNVLLVTLGVVIMAAACVLLHRTALNLVKGGQPDMNSAIICFATGGVHALTLLILMGIGGSVRFSIFLLLVGYAASDVIYGLITMKAANNA